MKWQIILKRSGVFIPGIRPGKQSAEYIDGVLTRLNHVWLSLHGWNLFVATVFTGICECPLLFGRNIFIDRCCRGHGLYVAGPVTFNVASV